MKKVIGTLGWLSKVIADYMNHSLQESLVFV